MSAKSTVRDVTFELLRSLGLTTVFGNPGSTEQPFLQDFPGDLRPGARRPRSSPWPTLSRVRPADSVIVNESTSTLAQQIEWLPTVRTGSFFATASGGIGWGVPAAVGVALGDRDRGVTRAVIGLIGEETPGVPGLDLPGLDIAAIARGFGCRAVDAATAEDLEREFTAALRAGTTTVIVVPTRPQQAML
jgi:benzoylformate decarboxylase